MDKLLSWLRKTGGAPASSGKDSAAHILYLKEKEPEVYASTSVFLEPKDYVNYRLTGSLAASFDDIAVTWVTDNRDAASVRYDRGLLRRLAIDGSKLPPLRRSTDIIGSVTESSAKSLGVKAGTQVVAGAGDMQASLVGSGCTEPYRFLVYLGTSAWATAHVPSKRTDIFHNIASLPSAIPGMYFIAAEQESAGSALNLARSLFASGAAPQRFADLDSLAATAAPAEGGILFAPWLVGERAPVEDKSLRGAFANVTLASGRAQMVRAVLEGVAYNTRWMLEPAERLAGKKAESVRVAGGGGTSALWCQILADVLRRHVHSVENPTYATARGAALLAGVGTGLTTFDAISKDVAVAREFSPRAAPAETYGRMYKTFTRFHRSIAPFYHEAQRLQEDSSAPSALGPEPP